MRKREREMFYLTTHSTHFTYGYMASDMVKDHSDSEKERERNVLFNDALNTFYSTVIWRQTWLRTILIVRKREREMFYLTTHSTHFTYDYMASDMVKDHSDSERERNVLFNDTLNTFYLTVIWNEGNVLFNDALNTFY